jgi:hypothetical protein
MNDTTAESTDVGPENYMTLGEVLEDLTGESITGVVDGFTPGPNTVTYHDEAAAFRVKAKDEMIGDDDSRLFVGSDGGELELSYGPLFDHTIVTNLKKGELRAVVKKLRQSGDSIATGDFTVHFDHAGPTVFETNDITVATCPVKFPWQWASADRPRSGPCGPTIRGDR